MLEVARTADIAFLSLVPIAIAAEQLVWAWKWRQLLWAIRPVGTLRLFGGIMAGYFANMIVPLGISPIVRSWLVARLEALKMGAVLATAIIDRLVDGLIFTGFVALALFVAIIPDPSGGIRIGLTIGGFGSLLLFTPLLFGLALYKRRAAHRSGWAGRLTGLLPDRFSGLFNTATLSFAEGIVWPREARRGVGIVLASVVIKVIAITHFLWAGLAFGVILRPADYVFLMVFLGFLIILTRFPRIPGGFFFGAIFALERLGVGEEAALAMVLTVQLSTLLTVGVIGALALWRSGIALDDLRLARGESVGGAILSIASNSKPAAENHGGLEQIKVVAGVGFEPTTFRL